VPEAFGRGIATCTIGHVLDALVQCSNHGIVENTWHMSIPVYPWQYVYHQLHNSRDPLSNCFTVDVDLEKTVYNLKKTISKEIGFGNAYKLELCKILIPIRLDDERWGKRRH
jgi:hypothetical protein